MRDPKAASRRMEDEEEEEVEGLLLRKEKEDDRARVGVPGLLCEGDERGDGEEEREEALLSCSATVGENEK